MLKSRLTWLILSCAGLGTLVWLDNPGGGDGPAADAVAPARVAAPEAVAVKPERRAQKAGNAGAAGTPPKREIGNPLASLDKAVLTNMVERPLFNSSRQRPPPIVIPPVSTPSAPVSVAPTYSLLGVVSDGNRAIALLRHKTDGTNLRVETGDMIGGWRVSRVEPKFVQLEREDGTIQDVGLLEE